MQDHVNATPTPHKRLPWNKGKLTGAKPPLRPKHVWAIRTKLQVEGRIRELAPMGAGEYCVVLKNGGRFDMTCSLSELQERLGKL